jgi:hypothetical protein
VDYLSSKKGIHSIRNDLIPILLKCQYDQVFSKKEGLSKCKSIRQDLLQVVNATGNIFLDAFGLSTTGTPQSVVPHHQSPQSTTESTSSALATCDANKSDYSEEIVCHAIILREKDGFCARANTVTTYLDANLKMARLMSASKASNKVEIGAKTQVSCCLHVYPSDWQ